MTTFSQLVDRIVTELNRPDRLAACADYVNAVMRELHFRRSSGSPICYDANRVEDQLVLLGSPPYTWPIPTPSRFMQMEAVYCPVRGIYLPQRTPSHNRKLRQNDLWRDAYWYRSGNSIAFSGLDENTEIQLSYFTYAKSLPYLPAQQRVITYNLATESYELLAGGGPPTEEQVDAESNWILQRWPTVVAEGARASIFRNTGDTDRAPMAYSAYESLRHGMQLAEPSTGIGQE